MLRASVVATVAIAGVVGARAYFDWEPTRIIVERDTLVLYGTGMTHLPYRIVTRRGEEVGWARAVMSGADSMVTFDGMTVACLRAGERDVALTRDELTARFHVSCRWPRSFHGPTAIELAVGGPPREVRIQAAFESGEMERVRPLAMSIGDTLVARLEEDLVVPLTVGRTSLVMDLGGSRSSIPVSVTHALARDTLALRPGEFRTWPLVAGRYDITVKSLAGARSFAELEMIAEGTQCVPSRLDRDMIHCLVRDTAVVALHNRHPADAPPSPRTAVFIIRTH